MGKYDPLQQFLEQAKTNEITVTFDEVEQILKDKLPRSAYVHLAWWANSESHTEANAWLNAGWKVESLDQQRELVTFRRTK